MIPHSKPYVTDVEMEYVSRILNSGSLVAGSTFAQLGSELRKYLGLDDTFFFSSGRIALLALLEAIKLKDGLSKNEIILSTYVCKEVAEAIEMAGFIPVFCDIDNHWKTTADCVAATMTKKTKAVIVAHIFGIFSDISSLTDSGLVIIEDCAQAFLPLKEKLSDLVFYSFHATKCLTTIAGGLAAVHNDKYRETLQAVAQRIEYYNGFNDLNSALGLAQLAHYDNMLATRQRIAYNYLEKLPPQLTAEIQAVATDSMFFRFPLRLKSDFSFEKLAKDYEDAGIIIRRGVDQLVHRNYGLSDCDFPTAIKVFNQTVSIPIYPALSSSEVEYIITSTNRIFAKQ